MTQPQQQQVSMLVCNDCGSVRVPVPAITSKIVVLNVPPTVTAPCPVCSLTKMIREAMAADADEEKAKGDALAQGEAEGYAQWKDAQS